MTATAKQAATVDDGMSADERAAYDEWRDAEAELAGKFQALQRATERQQRALSTMRRLALRTTGGAT